MTFENKEMVEAIKDTRDSTIRQETKLDMFMGMVSANFNKQFFAILGLLAAMIGVKVLGTDPLLDIATYINITAAVLLIGILGYIIHRNHTTYKITRTGWWTIAFLSIYTIITTLVYFRDLGIFPGRLIYVVRIFQGIALFGLAWSLTSIPKLIESIKR